MNDSSFSGVKITLALPDKHLRPNHKPFSKGGCIAKARATKEYRIAAYWHVRKLVGNPGPMWRQAVARAVWYLGKGAKILDDDNALASLKAAFDGMQDAGLVVDDRGIRHLSPIWVRDIKNPRVEIEVVSND